MSLKTLTAYEEFIYTLSEQYVSIQVSTVSPRPTSASPNPTCHFSSLKSSAMY